MPLLHSIFPEGLDEADPTIQIEDPGIDLKIICILEQSSSCKACNRTPIQTGWVVGHGGEK